MSPLADREKQLLLELARRALVAGVEKREPVQDFPDAPILQQPGGAFVTLHRRARLRGCVGQLPSKDPLVQVVAHCAKAAALEDPRFKPVPAEELAEIEIELSILSPLADATLEKIEAGKHGLVISRDWRRGVLLPQVATQFSWQAERFLEETCVKAGLEREAWKDPHTRIQAFTAEVFAEPALQPRVKLPR
ncbi:MAG: AmmeMemoRadiSam system protein A [Candidatus Acidiferrales bacterium]